MVTQSNRRAQAPACFPSQDFSQSSSKLGNLRFRREARPPQENHLLLDVLLRLRLREPLLAVGESHVCCREFYSESVARPRC